MRDARILLQSDSGERKDSIIQRPGYAVSLTGGLLLLFTFSILCLIFCPADAGEVSLFPLFSFEHDTALPRTDLNLAYPLLHFDKTATDTFAVMPFVFSVEKKGEPPATSVDFLWPFFTYRLKQRPGGAGSRSQTAFLLLSSHSAKKAPEGNYRKWTFFPFLYCGTDRNNHHHFILFPFIWYADDAYVYLPFPSTKPQSFKAFLPFYGMFKNLGGRELVRYYLFPLFTYVKHKHKRRYHFLWPFFGYGTGKDYEAYKVFPVFTYAKLPEGSTRLNYLWPLGYRRRTVQKDGIVKAIDFFVPLFMRLRTPKEKWDYYSLLYARRITPLRRQWSVLWPLFKTANFPKEDARSFTLFLLLFKYKNGRENNTLQFFPLFGRRRKPGRTRSFILWPLYHYKYDDYGAYTFKRNYLFPFYIRKVMHQKGGETQTRTIFFPFFASAKKSDGSRCFSALRIGYYDRADVIDRNWAPILRIYQSQHDAKGNFSKRVFWKLYVREHLGNYDRTEVNTLLFQWKRIGTEKEFNLLGGLIGVKRTPLKTTFKLLFMSLGKSGK